MSRLLFICLLLIFQLHSFAQENQSDSLLRDAAYRIETGDFTAARLILDKLIKINSNDPEANYLLSMLYFNEGKWEKSVDFSISALKLKCKHEPEAFSLKIRSMYNLKMKKKALEEYKKAASLYDSNISFHRVLADFYMEEKDPEATELVLKHLIPLEPLTAANHLEMAKLMNGSGRKVEAIFCLMNYLLLLPDSQASYRILKKLDIIIAGNVSQKEDATYITLNTDSKTEFHTVEMMMAFSHALNTTEDSLKDRPYCELFCNDIGFMFKSLEKLTEKDGSFWISFYARFYHDLEKAGHTDAFCYYIRKSDPSVKVEEWLEKHPEKVNAMLQWVSGKKRI